MSDLDSMPKTPYTPGEFESPIKYTDDGIFKMPRVPIYFNQITYLN